MTERSNPERWKLLLSPAVDWPTIESQTTFGFSILADFADANGGSQTFAVPRAPAKVIANITPVPFADVANLTKLRQVADQHRHAIEGSFTETWTIVPRLDGYSSSLQVLPDLLNGTMAVGVNPVGALDNFAERLQQAAAHFWNSIQIQHLYEVYQLRATGLPLSAMITAYDLLWLKKAAAGGDTWQEAERKLLMRCRNECLAAVYRSDFDRAAEYASIVSHIAESGAVPPVELVVIRQWVEPFAPGLAPLRVAKANTLTRLSNTFREGHAEWGSIAAVELIEHGIIEPHIIAADMPSFIGGSIRERKHVLGLSATNPYRRGFELVDQIQNETGLWFILNLLGYIAENPLRQLVSRIPSRSSIERTSPWATNARLEKLRDLIAVSRSLKTSPTPGMEQTVGFIRDVHEAIDANLKSIHVEANAAIDADLKEVT